mmetsp:Transcript_69631/g.137811  ORF Transcript_69631/g.137811 Transcript_69631/m.137811 type:complete len:220 (+) Transcript_69631:1430-2089(+)
MALLSARLRNLEKAMASFRNTLREGYVGATCSNNAVSESTSGLSTARVAKASPHSRKKALPWKGKPGRFARTHNRKSSDTGMMSAGKHPSWLSFANWSLEPPSNLRPSPSTSSSSSTSAFKMTTTSVGALSASSKTHTRPCLAALTSGASSYRNRPSSSTGKTVRELTVVSRCSCTYSRSTRSISNARSTATFLPTPWFPRSNTARSPACSHSRTEATV